MKIGLLGASFSMRRDGRTDAFRNFEKAPNKRRTSMFSAGF